MSFFENELIRNELEEMSTLYQEICFLMYSPYEQTEDSRRECLDKIERLIELQELVYFRAKYSSDSDAEEFVDMLRSSAKLLGVSPDVDISEIFTHMKEDISRAKEKLDKSV